MWNVCLPIPMMTWWGCHRCQHISTCGTLSPTVPHSGFKEIEVKQCKKKKKKWKTSVAHQDCKSQINAVIPAAKSNVFAQFELSQVTSSSIITELRGVHEDPRGPCCVHVSVTGYLTPKVPSMTIYYCSASRLSHHCLSHSLFLSLLGFPISLQSFL